MKNIYVLSSCDAWKDYSSRDIILVTTSIRKLRKEVKEQVMKQRFKVIILALSLIFICAGCQKKDDISEK